MWSHHHTSSPSWRSTATSANVHASLLTLPPYQSNGQGLSCRLISGITAPMMGGPSYGVTRSSPFSRALPIPNGASKTRPNYVYALSIPEYTTHDTYTMGGSYHMVGYHPQYNIGGWHATIAASTDQPLGGGVSPAPASPTLSRLLPPVCPPSSKCVPHHWSSPARCNAG
jgi:hypothetical protein